MLYQSSFLKASHERGFIHQGTDLNGLDAHLKNGPIVAYLGFDATATSLHVGNLLPIMWLRLLQKSGHKPVVLVGGATSKIADPTGKDTQRPPLSDEDVKRNIDGISSVFQF